MTGRTIVILALGATVLLAVGARLLDSGTASSATLAILALAVGTALAATAVAGAWRPPRSGQTPSAGSEPGPTLSASHSSSGRMARQSVRTSASALREPRSGPTG